MIAEALSSLGYKEFIVVGNDYEGINWIEKPKIIPTKKQVMDIVAKLPELKAAEQQAKEAARESAMAKLKALGLTDDEISALVP